MEERGALEAVCCDHGPEFISRRMLGWAEERKVSLVHIQPGRPMQNDYVESFHGRLRDECLNTHWFRTLNDVRQTLENCAGTTTPNACTVHRATKHHRSSQQRRAMEMWKAKRASHIPSA